MHSQKAVRRKEVKAMDCASMDQADAHIGCSTHPLASQFPVEIRLKFLNQRMFIRHILQYSQCMPGPLQPLLKCDHQGLGWNVSQNSNQPIKKFFCGLEFCPLEQFGE
jgi:hypothetical protein